MKPMRLLNARQQQVIGFNLLRLVSLVTVLPILGAVIYIFVRGMPAISWEFLTAVPRGGMREGGIMPAIVGTLYLTLGTAVFSGMIGVTFVGLFLTPVFYVLLRTVTGMKPLTHHGANAGIVPAE